MQADYVQSSVKEASGNSAVLGAIQAAASRTGVDFAYLVHKAGQESGFNPRAKANTSSATGLYQFVNQTWLQMVKENGAKYGLSAEASAITMKNGKADIDDKALREKVLNLRNDPVLSSAMAAEFTKDNKDYLDASVGGTIGSTELYMAHFLGAGGAEKFLKGLRSAPDQTGANLFPEAANANKAVFYDKAGRALSLRDIYNRFAAKFEDGLGVHALAANNNGADQDRFVLKRDLAALSSSFYQAPAQDSQDALRQGVTTSDTLFNVMIMAQKSINDTLRADLLDRAKKVYG